MSAKQLEALNALNGHGNGNTMRSLYRHHLIYQDGRNGRNSWTRGIRGDLILAGWTLAGLEQMHRCAALTALKEGT